MSLSEPACVPRRRTPLRHSRLLGRSRRGGGALEFAIAAPILLALVLAAVDIGRYVADAQRIHSAAAAVADLASQIEKYEDSEDGSCAGVETGRELAVLCLAAREVAAPLDLLDQGAVIVTFVSNTGGQISERPERWGRQDVVSQVDADALHGITLQPGEGAVFAEVVYRFRPFIFSGRLLGLDETWDVRSLAVRRPRLARPEFNA